MSGFASRLIIFHITAPLTNALPYPRAYWCSNESTPWEKCGIDAGVRMMEQIASVPVEMPHWWETLRPYRRQCLNCTPIWLMCLVEDTGSWDGGSALRLGSRFMFEMINQQQWLLPGYELMCEYFNDYGPTVAARNDSPKGSQKYLYFLFLGK